ncbi:hypothetical protein CLOM_g163 [Closterium sp. NIES-68]|nr:hypothetical protein CLOM_g163 [Closterium sp. NIES-68]
MAAVAVLPAPTPFKAARAVVAVMEAYRDARVQFVTKVGELAVSPQNAEALLSLGALQLLLPLAQDSMSSVRSAAMLSLGRLANVSHTWAHHLVQRNVLPTLCKALTGTNRHHKRSAAYLVKAVSRHAGAELAEAGVLPLLTECLLDAMLAVRETAACALGHVAKHSGVMAMRVVETGAVRLLVTCLQDEAVARIALSVLSDVARHSLLHATAVADAGGVAAAVSLLGSPDVKTRRQVLYSRQLLLRFDYVMAPMSCPCIPDPQYPHSPQPLPPLGTTPVCPPLPPLLGSARLRLRLQ